MIQILFGVIAHDSKFAGLQGGGSTFGIIVSVTVKAYPSISAVEYLFAYNTTADSDTFWSLVADFHTRLPDLSDSGVMGYYYAIPNDTSEADPATAGKVMGIWLVPQKTVAQVRALIRPMEVAIGASQWPDKVVISSLATQHPDFAADWSANPPEPVGFDGRLGSRLLGRPALSNATALKALLKQSTPVPWALMGNLVAGKGLNEVKIAGGNNSVNPAWRTAYVHLSKYPAYRPRCCLTALTALESYPAYGPT